MISVTSKVLPAFPARCFALGNPGVRLPALERYKVAINNSGEGSLNTATVASALHNNSTGNNNSALLSVRPQFDRSSKFGLLEFDRHGWHPKLKDPYILDTGDPYRY